MKSTQTILLFVTLLTGLVHITTSISNNNPYGFDGLVGRLQSLPTDLLPFSLRLNVMKELNKATIDFKKLFVKYDTKFTSSERAFSPIAAINQTIKDTFNIYRKKTKKSIKMLNNIQEVDPIGLNVYLSTKSSNEIDKAISEFHAVMYDRLKLFRCRDDTSFIELFKTNGILRKIPDVVRKEIATENTLLTHESINHFVAVVNDEKLNYHMYYEFNFQMRHEPEFSNLKVHSSNNTDDVQILFGGVGGESIGHWICINYKVSNQNIYVFDSFYGKHLNPTQEEIAFLLYPYHQDVVYVDPKFYQKDVTSCGIFAIFYATNLLLGKNLANIKPRLNNIYGDQSLYMRLHVMRMFANHQLAAFN